jgi:hypothetical protein
VGDENRGRRFFPPKPKRTGGFTAAPRLHPATTWWRTTIRCVIVGSNGHGHHWNTRGRCGSEDPLVNFSFQDTTYGFLLRVLKDPGLYFRASSQPQRFVSPFWFRLQNAVITATASPIWFFLPKLQIRVRNPQRDHLGYSLFLDPVSRSHRRRTRRHSLISPSSPLTT